MKFSATTLLLLLTIGATASLATEVAPPAVAAPQPLAERVAGAPSPAPMMDSPIEATGGKVVYAQPIAAVSGAPIVAPVAAPRLAWPKKQVVFEEMTLKKPKLVRAAPAQVSGVAPAAPLLVSLPPRELKSKVVPLWVKPGTASQPVLARKTLLPKRTIELDAVEMWVPARVAPAQVSGAPISGAPASVPLLKKKSLFGK